MKLLFNISNEIRTLQLAKGNELPTSANIEVDFSSLSQNDRELLMRHSLLSDTKNELYVGFDKRNGKKKVTPGSSYNNLLDQSITDARNYDRYTIHDAYDLKSLLQELRNYELFVKKDLQKELQIAQQKAREEKINYFQSEIALHYSNDWSAYERIFKEYHIPKTVQKEFKSRFETFHANLKAEIAHKKDLRENQQKEKEAKEQAYKKEMQSWINKNGSDHLKKMLVGEYECRMTYEQERCKADYPGFEIDTAGKRFGWEDRANPSLNALQQAEKTKGKVVWLIGDSESEEFDFAQYADKNEMEQNGCEAIVINVDWCRFSLLKSL